MQKKPKYPRKVRSTEKVTYGVDSPQKKQEKRKQNMTSERSIVLSMDNTSAAIEQFLLSMSLINRDERVTDWVITEFDNAGDLKITLTKETMH